MKVYCGDPRQNSSSVASILSNAKQNFSALFTRCCFSAPLTVLVRYEYQAAGQAGPVRQWPDAALQYSYVRYYEYRFAAAASCKNKPTFLQFGPNQTTPKTICPPELRAGQARASTVLYGARIRSAYVAHVADNAPRITRRPSDRCFVSDHHQRDLQISSLCFCLSVS